MASISLHDLETLLLQAASKYVTPEEAAYFAKEEVDTSIKKPRTDVLGEAIGDIENWTMGSGVKISVQSERSGSLLLNFNGLAPSLKLKYVHDELEKKAKACGIAMLGINNSAGIHTLNLWTDGLGKRDLVGICMFNGGPEGVVPFGGTRGLYGTNPLSYAIPTMDRPIIVDMATSEIPYFEIKNAKKEGRWLGLNQAVDSNGNPTLDPKAALDDSGTSNLLPMGGGYKGYALVLLIEILTGSLVRSFLSNEMTPSYVPAEHGGLLIAIDIGAFTELGKFKKSVSELCRATRSQKPALNVEKITIPGDRNYERLSKAIAKGEVEVEEAILSRLRTF